MALTMPGFAPAVFLAAEVVPNRPNQLELGVLAMGLFGGLALFLYGMDKLTDSLRLVAGDRMKGFLARMTTNRFKGVVAGAVITATIQSSSVTTVLVVGFISAGLLSLAQSIPIIMGAEIGTTITAQIIAFKVTKYSLLLLAVGFFVSYISRSKRIQLYGSVILGLGLIFFGMELMKESMSPLVSYQPFVNVMSSLSNPILAVAFSSLFTALVQSSSATTGVIIVLASQGMLSLEAGIALVFGANIGTCITALLASIGKPREAVRAAAVHILFNTSGVLIWLGLIPLLANFVRLISPEAQGLAGIEQLRAETPRQIANAHTIFNVANTLTFIGFTPLIARLVERLIPDRPLQARGQARRRRTALDDVLRHSPSLALDVVRAELAALSEKTVELYSEAVEPVLNGSTQDLRQLEAKDSAVDELHIDLVSNISQVSAVDVTPGQSSRLSVYVAAANYLEGIGDVVETNLVGIGDRRAESGVTFSMATQQMLKELGDKVGWALETATRALTTEDRALARTVVEAKQQINHLSERVEGQIANRLSAEESHRVDVFRLEVEMIEALRRIYYFAKRIARLVLNEQSHYQVAVAGDLGEPELEETETQAKAAG